MARGTRRGLIAGGVLVSAAAASIATGTVYQKSPNFAGYDFNSSTVTSASARFSIPTETCAGTRSGVGPGVFIVTTKNQLTGAGLIVACTPSETYQVATVVNGLEQNSISVRPKDVVFVQVHISSKGSSVTIHDLTIHRSSTQAGKGARSRYVSIGMAAVLFADVRVGVDKFTPVTFTNVVVQGTALSRWKPYAVERYRGPASHPIVEIRPGRLSPDGESFTLSYVHS